MKKIFLALLLTLFLGVFHVNDVHADSITCNLGSSGWSTSGSLQVCVGGFSSKDSLRQATISFICDKQSGAAGCGALVPVPNLSLSNLPDNLISQDAATSLFYTCETANGVNSQIEQMTIRVSGPGFCSFSASSPSLNSTGFQGSCGNGNIDTAIGCIPINNQNALIGFFLRWGIGIGGGIAFLLIIVAGFQIMTSRGDPNRLKAGQELMTSAIAGLLLLIFSIVILRIIGFDILKIGAFQ